MPVHNYIRTVVHTLCFICIPFNVPISNLDYVCVELHLCSLPTECLQMWLLKPSNSATSSACTRCHRCFFETAEKSNWFPAWRIIPCCGLLPPPLLFPFTLSTMDMLQKSPRTSCIEWIAAYYHSWLFPSESPCYDDEKLENCYRIIGL